MSTNGELEVAIACSGVTKSFGSGNALTLALRGIDLNVYAGQMTMLIGQSGCGKTTLISIMAGTLDPTQGVINIFDHDITRMSAAEKVLFRGKYIGFVFQQFNLLPALTAAENVMVPLLIAGKSRRDSYPRACDLLTKLGMGKRLKNKPNQLSGGQQQRVAIARALVHDPRLLVCDEPTSALDAESGKTVMELLRDSAVRPGRAVIIVTHDSRIFDFSDRTVEMEDGRVISIEEKKPAARPAAVRQRTAVHERVIERKPLLQEFQP
jgi:putative ABC transport system ATP-binding protein